MGLLWGCICVGSSDRFFLGGGVEVYVVGVYKALILYKHVIKSRQGQRQLISERG